MIIKINYLILLLITIAFFGCLDKSKEKSFSRTKISQDSILTLVQQQTFKYFWDGAEPTSGMARERFHVDGEYAEDDKNVVTTGGTGFGLMAILVGIEREFISRQEGFKRLNHIVNYLKKADRFHGVWPHWLFGETARVKPFSHKDDGADLVETAYLVQGLLTVRQYFRNGNKQEKILASKIDSLWKEVDWSWFRKDPKENKLYWHWSPNYNWAMNMPIGGYNECLITYVLAASSPTHPIPAQVYHEGWAHDGKIKYGKKIYDYTIDLRHNYAEETTGPLFWAHYSFLGLDPRKLKDRYADYWQHNKNHTLVHRKYAIENPKNYKGYSENNWGFTSSYSMRGYAGHRPGDEDFGVISPTAALSSFPYTPEYSMEVLDHFYYELGDKIWGKFGFYDAFSDDANWYPKRYLAIDQGPIVVMIENHRTGLLWDLFMSSPEIQSGLNKLGFEYK